MLTASQCLFLDYMESVSLAYPVSIVRKEKSWFDPENVFSGTGVINFRFVRLQVLMKLQVFSWTFGLNATNLSYF